MACLDVSPLWWEAHFQRFVIIYCMSECCMMNAYESSLFTVQRTLPFYLSSLFFGSRKPSVVKVIWPFVSLTFLSHYHAALRAGLQQIPHTSDCIVSCKLNSLLSLPLPDCFVTKFVSQSSMTPSDQRHFCNWAFPALPDPPFACPGWYL